MNSFKAIVIGTSAGGLNALKKILENLPADFKIPILIVQHLSANTSNFWIDSLNRKSNITVKEGEDKESIQNFHAYIAPPDYHMMINYDETLSLSKDEKVNFSRPSIDVLFESAADVYHNELIGIVLTGSNMDGSSGIQFIKNKGGIAIVQKPEMAEYKEMPLYALKKVKPDHVLDLSQITSLLIEFNSLAN